MKPTTIEPTTQLTSEIIAAAMEIHTRLGPGLFETTYEVCLLYELHKRGLKAERQIELPVIYDGVRIDAGYRIDILVEDEVILELKAVEMIKAVHEAQLISYLKLSGKRVGLLINFDVTRLKEGIVRRMN